MQQNRASSQPPTAEAGETSNLRKGQLRRICCGVLCSPAIAADAEPSSPGSSEAMGSCKMARAVAKSGELNRSPSVSSGGSVELATPPGLTHVHSRTGSSKLSSVPPPGTHISSFSPAPPELTHPSSPGHQATIVTSITGTQLQQRCDAPNHCSDPPTTPTDSIDRSTTPSPLWQPCMPVDGSTTTASQETVYTHSDASTGAPASKPTNALPRPSAGPIPFPPLVRKSVNLPRPLLPSPASHSALRSPPIDVQPPRPPRHTYRNLGAERNLNDPQPATQPPRPHSTPLMPQHPQRPAGAEPTHAARRRRELRRRQLMLGAERPRSASAVRHTRAAFGTVTRSAGAATLNARRSGVDLHSRGIGDASGALDSAGCGTSTPCGVAAVSGDHSDVDSLPGGTSPVSVAGSSRGGSPRLPWRPRSLERRSASLQVGAPREQRSQQDVPRDTTASDTYDDLSFFSSSVDDVQDDDIADSPTPTRLGGVTHLHPIHASISGPYLPESCVGGGARRLLRLGHRPGQYVAGDDTFMALSAAPSDVIPMTTPEGHEPAQSAGYGPRRDRNRYMRLLYSRETGRSPDTPPGVPSLNFKKYEFPMTRTFTFSDGSRVRMPPGSPR